MSPRRRVVAERFLSGHGHPRWLLLLLTFACLSLAQAESRAALPPKYPLTVTFSGNIGGVLVNGVPILRYAAGPQEGGQFTGEFYAGQVVTVQALWDSSYDYAVWSGWSGDVTSQDTTIRVPMDGPKTITTSFTPTDYAGVHNLTFDGLPAVAGYPGRPDIVTWDASRPLTERAVPAPGWRFKGWLGDLNTLETPVVLTVTQSMTMLAQFVPAGQAAVFYRQTFENDAKVKYSDWHYTSDWAVIPDVGTKPGIPSDPSPYGPAGLVYNPHGDYPPSIDDTVTTTAIDCSGYTGVSLTLLRCLTVDDSAFDQATIEVSKDGSNWTTVYRNPTNDGTRGLHGWAYLNDPHWYQMSYDISAVADGRKTVYLRFRLTSNGDDNHGYGFHGWAIDDITLSGAGPDPAYSLTPSGLTFPDGLTAYGPLPSLPGTLWQSGPAVSGGGQTRDADGDPSTPGTETVGVDPGTNAAGGPAETIVGTAVGDNYPAGMSGSQYLQWGPLDLTGLQQTAVGFSRWLEVGTGDLDRASRAGARGHSSPGRWLDGPHGPGADRGGHDADHAEGEYAQERPRGEHLRALRSAGNLLHLQHPGPRRRRLGDAAPPVHAG